MYCRDKINKPILPRPTQYIHFSARYDQNNSKFVHRINELPEKLIFLCLNRKFRLQMHHKCYLNNFKCNFSNQVSESNLEFSVKGKVNSIFRRNNFVQLSEHNGAISFQEVHYFFGQLSFQKIV